MSAFTKQVTNEAKRSREAAKRMLKRTQLLKRPELKEAFEAFPLCQRRHINMSLSDYSDNVRLSLTLRGLDSFKDKRLTDVLSRFIDWETTVSDYTFGQPNKDFVFTKRMPDGFEITVMVWAYVKSDSPLCRIVITGIKEEIVRTEIKEIVCA